MICLGRGPIEPAKAVALGFAFDAVPPGNPRSTTGLRLDRLSPGERASGVAESPRGAEQPVGLTDDQANFTVRGVAEGFVKGKTKGQYPAPLASP